MANKRIRMSKLRQILTLKSTGHSNGEIKRILGMSKTTVLKYVHAADHLSQDYSALLSLSDQDLESVLLFREEPILSTRLSNLADRFSLMERELKRVGVTRWRLWTEYKSDYPEGYNYSRFCHYFRQWRKTQQAVMHFEHKAGDKLEIDYTGKKLEFVSWPDGEICEVEVFVAILSSSQYTYVEASPSQKSEDFISSTQNALHYFGGVPRGIVSDNLKSAVTLSSPYEPKINQTFEDFGNHYRTSILATRPIKPRDKPLVENAVAQVYRQIYAAMRNEVFHSLEELNTRIQELLPGYNSRHFQGKDHSRKDLFEQMEKQELASLPLYRFVIKHYVRVKVQQNCHVYLSEDKHYYSVPYRYIGQRVRVIYTRDQVEIFSHRQRIAYHLRDRKRFGYTSITEHLPSHHRYILGQSPEKFIKWASRIGVETQAMVKGILESRPHPEQAFKSCRGVLALAKKVGNDRVNQACKRAMSFHSYSYMTVKNILDKGIENLEEEQVSTPDSSHIPDHPNIRGNQYYQ